MARMAKPPADKTSRRRSNEEAWATLHSETSRAFDKPKSGRIAVKVINDLGDEVIGLARSGTGAVQRELARLEASGLVTVTRVGKQKHRFREASVQLVYGSIAKGQDTAASDIDLTVITDRLTCPDLFAALEEASAQVGRKGAPTIYSPKELSKRVKQDMRS